VIRAANAQYDQETSDRIAEKQAKLAALDALIVTAPDLALRLALLRLRPSQVQSIANYQSALGKQRYFRSVGLTGRSEWYQVQVTPGGRIEFKFIGAPDNCGNTLIYEKRAPARYVRRANWNWNIPGSTYFRPQFNPRRLITQPTELGIYRVVDNDG